MEITTDNATSGITKADEITLVVEPVSDINNDVIITITGMEPEFYKAAMDGNINAFKGMGKQIGYMLTPNNNTVLHIHFTNYTNSVSETFVDEVLDMCPTLVLKTNVKGETILHIAARYGHHEIVKKLIQCAKDINDIGAEKSLIRATNDKNETALHEAARYGHIKVVEDLIKEEPDHSYFGKNIDNETPLYIAVERQHWNMVDTMLDNSDSPQYNGPNGRTALHASVLHGDKGKVSKLLNKNLPAAKQADEHGWVPLHLAALCANSDVVELLVSKDRSTAYRRDNKGRTALHFAAFHKDSSVMEIILKYCPDCSELVDEKGSNALHYTTVGDNYWCFELKENLRDAPLIRNLYNEKDDDGNTPLHLLARQPPKKDEYCDHSLLKLQFPIVDTMACDKCGQTALDVAVADVPPYSPYKNKLLTKLQGIGARLGGRVLDNRLREKKKEKRHDSAVDQKEDYLAKRESTISLAAILIATATFTAALKLPGGLNQEKGFPILKNNSLFIFFVVTDALSFVLSTASVFAIFLSSSTHDIMADHDMYESLLNIRKHATLTALFFMVMAFGAGLGAVLGTSKGVGDDVTWRIVFIFYLIYCIILFKVWRVKKRARNYSLRRVRDVHLSRTV